jgi:hypothetical protein
MTISSLFGPPYLAEVYPAHPDVRMLPAGADVAFNDIAALTGGLRRR